MFSIKRLSRRIFNNAPYKNAPNVKDNLGRKIWYKYFCNPVRNIYFYYQEKHIGEIKLDWHENKLEIVDIVIFPSYKKYRGNGIGTKMFMVVKDLAKKQGVAVIVGRMRPEETSGWERLIRFYEKQGCRIDGDNFILEI